MACKLKSANFTYPNAATNKHNKGNGHAEGIASNAHQAGEESSKGHHTPQQPEASYHAIPTPTHTAIQLHTNMSTSSP